MDLQVESAFEKKSHRSVFYSVGRGVSTVSMDFREDRSGTQKNSKQQREQRGAVGASDSITIDKCGSGGWR